MWLFGWIHLEVFLQSELSACMASTSSLTDHCPQAIQDMMMVQGQEPIEFEDVKDEIFDMVKPQFPLIITLQDLITWCVCGGGVFVCVCVGCLCVILVNYS